MKRLHVYYAGRVHGVGFRYTVHDQALKHHINGWVKNTADSKVEVVAEGAEKALEQFMTAIESIMAIYIIEKSAYSEPATGEFVDFRITY